MGARFNMNDILQKNLDSFLERYPSYASRLLNADLDQIAKKFSIQDEEGQLFLLEDGKPIDRSNFSDYNLKLPQDRAVRLLLIKGFGMGGFFQRIVNINLPETYEIIVLESSIDRFLYALSLTDYGGLFSNKKFHWFIGLKPDEFFAHSLQLLMSRPRCQFMGSWLALDHPTLSSCDSKYFDVVIDEWQAAQIQVMRSAGHRQDSLLGIRKLYENTLYIEENPGVQSLKNAFPGKPAIVVASGPSLDKSIPLLKDLQHKALILSADASAKILLENEIEPHFVLSLERVEESLPFFESISSYKGKIKTNFLAYPIVPKKVCDAFPGDKWVVYRNHSYFYFLENQLPRGVISSASSVTHFCARFAEFLGANPIALVGQDLAYDPENLRSHADGLAYEDWSKAKSIDEINKSLGESNEGQVILVPGNFQEQVPSNSTYFSMLKEFSLEALSLKSQLINCTEGGARIPNVEWKSLEALSKSWGTFDYFQKIKELRPTEYKGKIDWDSIFGPIKGYETRLEQLLLQATSFLEDKVDASELSKAVQLFRSTCKVLIEEPLFRAFIMETSGHQMLEIENRFYAFPDRPGYEKEKLQVLIEWFSELHNVAQQLGQIFQNSQLRVAAS